MDIPSNEFIYNKNYYIRDYSLFNMCLNKKGKIF